MQDIRVILFDLDDTLIRFDDYWEASLMETFRQHSATREIAADRLFEQFWEQNTHFERQYLNQRISLRQFRNFRLMEALARFGQRMEETIADEFNELHRTISKSYMKADPDVTLLLEQLSSVYALGIVTNGTVSWQMDKITAMGIGRLFSDEAVIISEQVGVEKPTAEIYTNAMEVFQTAPEHVVFVGDSWQNDVEGPGKLGIRSIWLNPKADSIPDSDYPYLLGTVSRLTDIRTLLLPTHTVN